MPYGAIHTYLHLFAREIALIRDFRISVIIFFFFFIFSSQRPSTLVEPAKSLIFIPNRFTIVSGVHQPQAIVILALHVSRENRYSLHDTTMNDAIFYSAKSILSAQHISTTVFSGGLPPVIIAIEQPKQSFLHNEEGYRDGKLWKTRETNGCISHPCIFVELLQDSEAWRQRYIHRDGVCSLLFPLLTLGAHARGLL